MSEIMLSGLAPADGDTGPEVTPLGEGRMVGEDCLRQVHRWFHVERRSKSEIATQLALDRKTVRSIFQAEAWRPYTRAERADAVTVEAEETITVPAGTFKTFKVVYRNKGTGAIRYEEWYSPELKHPVLFRENLASGLRVRELIAFKLR